MTERKAMKHNIVSVSGGKDSTALLLLAIERETENLQAVFADTGHEHPQTYEYVKYLNDKVFPIKTVKADFSEAIQRRREMMLRVIAGEHKERANSKYEWTPEIAEKALKILQPTGNPFFDMCLVHGRFPSTKVRFCSQELKRDPMIEQVQMPLMDAGNVVWSWQGVRADESLARRDLPELECVGSSEENGEMWNYRPILSWTVEDVFAMHRKHNINPNPLYSQGMGRVGCMPCIHTRKDELLEISRRFPEEIERVAEWERLIAKVSKTSKATFFSATELGAGNAEQVTLEKHGIWAKVEWSKTSRGGSNYDFFRVMNDGPTCTSVYGLCE
jgi:3'-phosphoadenosine 5'-phosphosulfate sulfotransferase (PAPS reductase)/FAD synthetase